MSKKIEYLIDCLQSAFSLKIRLVLIPTRSPGPWKTLLVLIPASAIAKNDILAVYIIIQRQEFLTLVIKVNIQNFVAKPVIQRSLLGHHVTCLMAESSLTTFFSILKRVLEAEIDKT